jgi:hypothetical protein
MNPYRIWLRPFLFATILLLAGTAALTPFRGKAAILGMVAVSSLGVCAAFATLALWFSAWRADAHLAAFEQGVYLAHWAYNPTSGARTSSRRRRTPAVGVLGVAGVAAFGLLAGWGIGSLALAWASPPG